MEGIFLRPSILAHSYRFIMEGIFHQTPNLLNLVSLLSWKNIEKFVKFFRKPSPF